MPETDMLVDYGPDTREEIEIKKKLFDLRCEYLERVNPLIQRLSDIRALKTPRYLVLPVGWPS